MTPLKLTSAFRARMVPLVLATAVVVAVSTPAAYYLRERLDLVRGLRGDAEHVGQVLRTELEARPRLWRYSSTKLSERLAEEGLSKRAVHVIDAAGARVRLDAAAPPEQWALWGRADLVVDGRRQASVWVAADQRPLMVTSLELGLAFGLLAALLASVLYLVPLRHVARAERRVELLLGRLALGLQEEDRQRIARDLHDGVGQAITAARLELLAVCARAGLATGEVRSVACRLDEALDEVRRSTSALAPAALAELGLPRALERHCAAFAATAGIAVDCTVQADLPPLGADVESACYRIVQEALANTARYAGATRASVQLRALDAGGVALEIGDDGAGLPDDAAGRGSGLEGIRQRARLLGGDAAFTSHAGGGVRLEVTLPASLDEAAR